MTAEQREMIQAVELKRQSSAMLDKMVTRRGMLPAVTRAIAEDIVQNADDLWNHRLSFDDFHDKAVALWDEAQRLGIKDDVLEIITRRRR